jgi:hypothetical protein
MRDDEADVIDQIEVYKQAQVDTRRQDMHSTTDKSNLRSGTPLADKWIQRAEEKRQHCLAQGLERADAWAEKSGFLMAACKQIELQYRAQARLAARVRQLATALAEEETDDE